MPPTPTPSDPFTCNLVTRHPKLLSLSIHILAQCQAPRTVPYLACLGMNLPWCTQAPKLAASCQTAPTTPSKWYLGTKKNCCFISKEVGQRRKCAYYIYKLTHVGIKCTHNQSANFFSLNNRWCLLEQRGIQLLLAYYSSQPILLAIWQNLSPIVSHFHLLLLRIDHYPPGFVHSRCHPRRPDWSLQQNRCGVMCNVWCVMHNV